jgi:hypothetical protein
MLINGRKNQLFIDFAEKKEEKEKRRHFSSPVNARFVRPTIILINR